MFTWETMEGFTLIELIDLLTALAYIDLRLAVPGVDYKLARKLQKFKDRGESFETLIEARDCLVKHGFEVEHIEGNTI